ncbi:hypothetical protein ACRRTK_013748 [Alexandromys fortis]
MSGCGEGCSPRLQECQHGCKKHLGDIISFFFRFISGNLARGNCGALQSCLPGAELPLFQVRKWILTFFSQALTAPLLQPRPTATAPPHCYSPAPLLQPRPTATAPVPTVAALGKGLGAGGF